MIEIIVAIFVLGYLFIALEHPIKIDKAATAIVTGILCWTVFILFSSTDSHWVVEQIEHHLIDISEILFLEV